jgi:hypothetical protein
MAYVKKLNMMIVEQGPKWPNLEVPNKGRTKLKVIAGTKVRKIPKKQYLIWIRSKPIEFSNDLIKKNIPPEI